MEVYGLVVLAEECQFVANWKGAVDFGFVDGGELLIRRYATIRDLMLAGY